MSKKKKGEEEQEGIHGDENGHSIDAEAMDAMKQELSTLRGQVSELFVENNSLRQAIERERNHEEQSTELLHMETTARIDELEHELLVANERIRKYELEQAADEVVRKENARLRQSVKDLTDKIEDIAIQNALEQSALKKEAFNSRIQLEKMFRKTLQELDRENQAKAFEEMNEESKNALIEKERVKSELALQTIGIEALTSRYFSKSKELKTLETDYGIVKEHQAEQAKKLAKMGQKATQLEESNQILQAKIVDTEKTVKRTEFLEKRCKTLENDIMKMDDDYSSAKLEVRKLKAKLEKSELKLKGYQEKFERRGKRKQSQISQNDELWKAITNLGSGSSSSSSRAESERVTVTKISSTMKECSSMPVLKGSQYDSILDDWNQSTRKNIG